MSPEEQLKEALDRLFFLQVEVERFVSEQDAINAKLIKQIKLLNEDTDRKMNDSYRNLFPTSNEGETNK